MGTISVGIAITDKDVVIWLKDKLGGTIHSKKPYKQVHKPLYQWRLMGKKATPILKEIHPYLIIKKKHVQLALDYLSTLQTGRTRKLSTYIRNQRSRIKQELRILNKRGADAQLDFFDLNMFELSDTGQLRLSSGR